MFAPGLSGDTILLQHGPLEFKAGADVLIWGLQSGEVTTTISASGSNVVQVDHGAQVQLSGVNIENGTTLANGGGVNNAGTLTTFDGIFSGNTATGSGSMGGAIFNTGTLIVANPSDFHQ